MGEPNYVVLNIQTENIIPISKRAVGRVGIIGYSETLKAADGTVGEYSDIQALRAVYGVESGLARSAALAFQNGANPVIVANHIATSNDNQLGGTPGPVSFLQNDLDTTLPGTDLIAVGSLLVQSPSAAAPTVTYIEGPNPSAGDEYYVDYSARKVIWHAATGAPAAGEITHDMVDEAAGDLSTSLTALANEDVQLFLIAQAFGTDVLSGAVGSLSTHIDATALTVLRKRIGICMNQKGIANTTLKTAIEGAITAKDRISLFHHNSLYDVAAIVAGMMSQLKPQQSPVMKEVLGDDSDGNFTDTEYTTFNTNQINSLVNSAFTPQSYVSVDGGYTLSASLFTKFVDAVRVIDDSSFKIKAALTTPSIIGEIDLSTVRGMNTLRATLNRVLTKMVNEGEINSFTYSIPLENTVRKAPADRNADEISDLQAAVAARKFGVDIEITYGGAVHSLDPVNVSYSGV